MRVSSTVWVGLVLLAAGCAAPPEASLTDPFEGGPALQATATTGVLRGVVVDDAVRPIAGADVVVRGPDGTPQQAASDEAGLFGFGGLTPGTYFVTVSKLAYTGSQVSVEVVAAVSEPPIVKVQLVYLPSEAPFATTLQVDAFVQCIVPGANLCAIANLYPCAWAGYCEPVVEDTSFVFLFDGLVALQRVPDWVQAEIVWSSTQAVSPQLAFRVSAHSPDDGAGIDERSLWVHGGSPTVIPWNATTLAEWEIGLAEGLAFEVFGHMQQTEAIGSFGFVVNQRVSFFFHVFYGYTPPEGWQFSVDGDAPPPV